MIKIIVFLSRLQSVSRGGSVSVLRRLFGGYSDGGIQKVTQEPTWVFRACKWLWTVTGSRGTKKNNRLNIDEGDLGGDVLISANKNQNKT